jgi:hypothetical protein
MEVTKIATTFMATVDVIHRAAEAGVNLIITHEPTWFTGMDGTDWLAEDEVYRAKKALIEPDNIAIWRFHDHMHMAKEDGIFAALSRRWVGTVSLIAADHRYARLWRHRQPDGCYEIPKLRCAGLWSSSNPG